jgi:hypothetical protein
LASEDFDDYFCIAARLVKTSVCCLLEHHTSLASAFARRQHPIKANGNIMSLSTPLALISNIKEHLFISRSAIRRLARATAG